MRSSSVDTDISVVAHGVSRACRFHSPASPLRPPPSDYQRPPPRAYVCVYAAFGDSVTDESNVPVTIKTIRSARPVIGSRATVLSVRTVNILRAAAGLTGVTHRRSAAAITVPLMRAANNLLCDHAISMSEYSSDAGPGHGKGDLGSVRHTLRPRCEPGNFGRVHCTRFDDPQCHWRFV